MTDAELDEIDRALKLRVDKFRNMNRAIAKYALKIQNLSAGEKNSIYEMVQLVHETLMPLLGDDETVSGLIGRIRDRYGKLGSSCMFVGDVVFVDGLFLRVLSCGGSFFDRLSPRKNTEGEPVAKMVVEREAFRLLQPTYYHPPEM